jgi:hypothetical protein
VQLEDDTGAPNWLRGAELEAAVQSEAGAVVLCAAL